MDPRRPVDCSRTAAPLWRGACLGGAFGSASMVSSVAVLWHYPRSILIEIVVCFQETLITPIVMTALHGAAVGWAPLLGNRARGRGLPLVCVAAALVSMGLEKAREFALLQFTRDHAATAAAGVLEFSPQACARSGALALALWTSTHTGSLPSGAICYWGCLVSLGLLRDSSRVPQLLLAGVIAFFLSLLVGHAAMCRENS